MRMFVMTTEDLYSDSRRQVEKEYRFKVNIQIEASVTIILGQGLQFCVYQKKTKFTLKPLMRTV